MSATPNGGYLKKIAKKVLDGSASKEEKLFLKEYYDAFGKQSDIAGQLTEVEKDVLKAEIRTSVIKKIEQNDVVPLYKRITFIIPVAAAILLFISAGLLVFDAKRSHQPITKNRFNKNDIIAGGNKAVLILADGSKIILDNAANGVIANQAGLIIKKTKDGQIVYNMSSFSSTEKNGVVVFNTIQTPKGGQYQVNLPDGSKVWLNAASSLRFPTIFTGKERNVELTGEAYFEVAKNKNQPFRVTSNNQVTEVIGTHFNINSYPDEPAVKTTLLEGSIKVTSGLISNVIMPGEQAQIKPGSNKIIITQVDTDGAIAWKNGLFLFKDSDIREVMRQLSRWYDVEVDYEGAIPNRAFSGKIYKNVNLSQVLDILSFTNIHFTIQGKRIIVTP